MAVHILLAAIALCALYGVYRKREGRREPFVTVYASLNSAVLLKDGEENADSALSLMQLIREKVPALGPDATIRRVWWLPGGHAQTMYSSVADFSKVDPVVYERKFLQFPDQGIVAVDISPPLASAPVSEGENVLLVAHGLTGGSHEAYVRAVLARVTPPAAAGGLGFRAVVLNFRGCNGSPVVTPKLYHAGSSDDIRNVVLWICHTFPGCRIYGLGFSLGANILAKYAGEEGDKCPLQALMTLANPWDFREGSHYLPGTFFGKHIYRYVLGDALRRLLYLHRKVFFESPESPLSRPLLEEFFQRPKVALRNYDETITAPLYGFQDAYDYYTKISSSRVVGNVQIPYLSINSMDDPITGTGGLPIQEVRDNPWVVLAVTREGGHLGWYERGRDGRIGRWYVKPVEQFLRAFMEYGANDRRKPRGVVDGADFVRDADRGDVGFKELSPEQSELVVSGVEVSKLFTGW